MKKIAIVLAVLMAAAPAMATVTITADVVQREVKDSVTGDLIMVDTDTVIIGWTCSGADLVRAFALDITLEPNGLGTSDPVIQEVIPLDANYWVYPGSIVIIGGVVNDYGSPVAPSDFPGTMPGLDTNAVTIEMGSLYAAGETAPGTSGDLLAIVVNDNCVLSVEENTVRGGIIMEDGSPGSSMPSPKPVNLFSCPPHNAAEVARWRAVGRPKCWCRGMNPRQCHGDADGIGQGKQNNIYVSTYDADVFNAAKNLSYAAIIGQTITIVGSGQIVPLVCADFDHAGSGKQAFPDNIAVSYPDSEIFNDWKNQTGLPDCNCP